MIRLNHVTVRFGSHVALDDLSIGVDPGEFVLITGPSGCGKSTLARCLNGMIPQSVPASVDGQIEVEGQAIAGRAVSDLATSVGLVFQNPATQIFCLTVAEEVSFGPRNLGLDEGEIERRTAWALAATGLAAMARRRVSDLSGGEQQRLAIASVVAMKPRVLILDEPTSHLDVRGRADLMSVLGWLREHDGLTVIVVEHRLGDVARMAGRTVVMEAGRIVADGETESVFRQRDLLRRLGLRRPAAAAEEDWPTRLVPRVAGRGEPIVEMRGVEAGYGRRPVLSGLGLTLLEGEFTALVGDNGSGKSTVARLLAGLLKPLKGSVRWHRDRARPGQGVGLVFENPLDQLFCTTVEEEVAFGPRNVGRYDQGDIDSLLSATGLEELRARRVHQLSAGQQQRAAVAASLALRPRLIVLDEPTMGQDWRHLSLIMSHLAELNRTGCTVLLISHDYKLVHRYADRVLLLRDGRIIGDGRPAGPYRPMETGVGDEAHGS